MVDLGVNPKNLDVMIAEALLDEVVTNRNLGAGGAHGQGLEGATKVILTVEPWRYLVPWCI